MAAAEVEAGLAGAEAGRSGLRPEEAEAAGLSAVVGDLDPVPLAADFIIITGLGIIVMLSMWAGAGLRWQLI